MKTSIFILSLFLLSGLSADAQRGKHYGGHDKGGHNKGGHNKVVIHQAHPPVVYRGGGPHIRSVTVVPHGAVVIKHRNVNYHYHNGYYYRPYHNSYRIIGPPVGVRIHVLPVGYYRWSMGPSVYFYFGGVYYSQIPRSNQYQVIRPPIGSTVPSLPDDYNEIESNGEILLEVNGILYRAVDTNDGRFFEVVGFL